MTVLNKVAVQQLIERITDDLDRIKVDVRSLVKKHTMLNNPNLYDTDVFQCILESEASRLHGFYTGIEKIIERLVKYETGSLPGGKASHQELLLLAKDKGLVSDTQHTFLRKLSSTRHFLRHAYGVELDLTQLQEIAIEAIQMWPNLETTFTNHVRRLTQMALS